MSDATFDPRVHNRSGNEPFESVVTRMAQRRRLLKGGLGIAALGMLPLAGCGSDDAVVASDTAGTGGTNTGGAGAAPAPAPAPSGPVLKFDSIAGARLDAVVVPPGYTAQVLAPWGEPLTALAGAWQADGSNTALDQANAVGMHHDGMWFFPIGGSSTEGLLAINHEYIDEAALHPNGPTTDASGKRPSTEELRKEINAHGVSVVRVRMAADGTWQVVANDALNRRYTGATEMDVTGPLAGSDLLITPYSNGRSVARGTLNNCGNGYTPWGTYLTCEENWPGYFVNNGTLPNDQVRIGMTVGNTRYRWEDGAGAADEVDGEFARFDLTPKGASAAGDYRNEANGHGYIVEIDPYTSDSRAVKRTALGRFRHEGCVPANPVAGQPVVFYSAHDARGEYIYKFVSDALWDTADADPVDRMATGSKYMDAGTLYVARFDADGTGEWLPLTTANPALAKFANQAEIIINTLEAADLVGATPMDRPEWGAVDPVTNSVYFTLTNNSRRGTTGSRNAGEPNARAATDAANPRGPNNNGHIIRFDEGADVSRFTWDIFVFGSYAGADADTNLSGLQVMNQFASPDGLVFDPRGILWIQTDNGAPEVAGYTNDQMLAVVPSVLVNAQGKQVPIETANQDALRRFFVGPNGCEVTGLAFTPDLTTFFVNIQHPGNWPSAADAAAQTPAGQTVRPRAATVVIRKADGTAVGT